MLAALGFLLDEQPRRVVALLLPVAASCNVTVCRVLAAAVPAPRPVTGPFLLTLNTRRDFLLE